MGRSLTRRSVFEADHEAFRDSVARFLAAEAVPHYEDWDAKGGIPAAFWDSAREYGFVGLTEADDPRFAAVALEEAMAAGLPAVALALAVHDSFALPLLAGRETPRIAAVVEGLVADTDGGWGVSGTAGTVLNGMGADLLVVGAATDDGSVWAFVVDPAADAVHRSPAEPLLGLDALDVADLSFDAARAKPLENTSFEIARAGYQLALAIAAMAGARTALTMTVEYVKQRKAFGRPIAEFENTRVVLGQLGARITAVGTFVDSALTSGSALTPEIAAAAKLCACDLLAEAVDTGVQLHGGYGYMWEYPIARAYAAARFFRVHGSGDDLLSRSIGL